MLHQAFNEVYTKFKLHFYQEIFRRFQDREQEGVDLQLCPYEETRCWRSL